MVMLFGVPVAQVNFGIADRFTLTERAIFDRIVHYVLDRRRELGLTPTEIARLQRGSDEMKISTILVVIDPLRTHHIFTPLALRP